MGSEMNGHQTRRDLLATRLAASGLIAAGGTSAWAQEALASPAVRRNMSSFRVHDWRDHFDSLRNGVILSDTTSRMLQFWSEDGSVQKIYPTSVPLSDDLTRLGYTEVTAGSRGRAGRRPRR